MLRIPGPQAKILRTGSEGQPLVLPLVVRDPQPFGDHVFSFRMFQVPDKKI